MVVNYRGKKFYNISNMISHLVVFLTKVPTVLLDGARLANTCTRPSFQWNAPTPACGISTPKNMFASVKKIAKLGEMTFS